MKKDWRARSSLFLKRGRELCALVYGRKKAKWSNLCLRCRALHRPKIQYILLNMRRAAGFCLLLIFIFLLPRDTANQNFVHGYFQ